MARDGRCLIRVVSLFLLCTVLGLSANVPAAADSVASWSEEKIDLVVRDKHGRAVPNLSPDQLQLLQDGKPVSITSLRLASADQIGPEGDGGRCRFVSFLLNGDRDLSRAAAAKALAELAKQPDHSNIYVAIWEVRDRFTLLHNFSNDLVSLKAVLLNRHGNTAAPDRQDFSNKSPLATARESAERASGLYATLAQQQHWRPSAAALLALADAEKTLTGRKLLLLFSDGAELNALSGESASLLLSAANRAQVSLYTVDLSGVTRKAAEQAARDLIDARSINTDGTQIMRSATNAAALSGVALPTAAGSQSRLQFLSAGTGGLYIDGSGSFGKFVRTAYDDSANFYEITYRQPLLQPEMHFRQLTVRCSVRGLNIQSRSGAFPSMSIGGTELSGFEIPLFAALSHPVREETIWLSGTAFPVSPASGPAYTNLALDLPLNGLMAHELDETKRFRFRVSLLALLKDDSGKILDKVGRDITLEGALETLSQARKSSYALTLPFALASSGCHVEVALRDEFAAKISTKVIDCTNAAPDEAMSRSSETSAVVEARGEAADSLLLTSLSTPELLKNGVRPSQSQIDSFISGARKRVLEYRHSLPNFICMRVTRRWIDPTGKGVWKPGDSSSSLLTYVDGKETTVALDASGRPELDEITDDSAEVTGEFGGVLGMPFEDAPDNFAWEGEAELKGKRTEVFRFTVPQKKSTYLLARNANESIYAAYHAFVFIDADTFAIRRVSVIADGLKPQSFMRESQLTVDYDYVPISGTEYLLPVHASLLVHRHGRMLNRNEIDFQNYRKYGAESRLLTLK